MFYSGLERVHHMINHEINKKQKSNRNEFKYKIKYIIPFFFGKFVIHNLYATV